MTKREDRIQQVVQFVKQNGKVSIKDIAEALDISRSYARELTMEALERDLIDGAKSAPIIGYIFNGPGRGRADGGQGEEGDLRVLTTRAGLLAAVKEYAPNRYAEAQGKDLESLRKFVRDHVADATVPVGHAWRLHP